MRWGRLHAGLDIAVPAGTPIRAADSGRVVLMGWVGGYGNYTCIQHTASLSTCYAHQSSFGDLQRRRRQPGPGDRLGGLHRPLLRGPPPLRDPRERVAGGPDGLPLARAPSGRGALRLRHPPADPHPPRRGVRARAGHRRRDGGPLAGRGRRQAGRQPRQRQREGRGPERRAGARARASVRRTASWPGSGSRAAPTPVASVRVALSSGRLDPDLDPGDDILVTEAPAPPEGAAPPIAGTGYTLYDFQRGPPMLLLAGLFVLVVLVFARLKGALSLVGLAVSLVVVVRVRRAGDPGRRGAAGGGHRRLARDRAGHDPARPRPARQEPRRDPRHLREPAADRRPRRDLHRPHPSHGLLERGGHLPPARERRLLAHGPAARRDGHRSAGGARRRDDHAGIHGPGAARRQPVAPASASSWRGRCAWGATT